MLWGQRAVAALGTGRLGDCTKSVTLSLVLEADSLHKKEVFLVLHKQRYSRKMAPFPCQRVLTTGRASLWEEMVSIIFLSL